MPTNGRSSSRPRPRVASPMGDRLTGRVALVTGSTRGIGRSIAEVFSEEGAAVAVAGRSVERGEKVADRIRSAGGNAAYFPLDVADEESVRSVIDAVVDHFGTLTTLVNNAAPTSEISDTIKPMWEYTTSEWNSILTATLTGSVFWTTKYAWQHLSTADFATIVNVSSGSSIRGHSGISAYSAAKGGMNSLTRAIAAEGVPFGVRCNCIVVGRVVAGGRDRGPAMMNEHGVGGPMEIATTALFLCSQDSSFINGDVITADGGISMNADVDYSFKEPPTS
jgi:meso-butanediol dehydrogenase / (S,S)-butanediol dehydrogenase / diacetyl reductase